MPALSVIVVGFNMARELPRTIQSLSPAMQRDILASEYEIIVLDNGSDLPVDETLFHSCGANLRVHRMEPAPPSPAPAINVGLGMARGDLIGVMIDGARMASPGLLAMARRAARLHHRPVIGTLGFHLGPEVQMESVRKGYNQETEDALLAASGWEQNGYRLFDIAVFAGSSAGGWFVTPSECNALFLPRSLWEELGGYDEGFSSPGGGLVNLDTWARACDLPDSEAILLLGEGTFHQVHGGIATNRADPPHALWHEEFRRVRGRDFCPPTRRLLQVGDVSPHALPSITGSARPLAMIPAPRPPEDDQAGCVLPPSTLSTIQGGVLKTRYRGRALLKSPFDLVLYLQLLERLRPGTVIEIGVKEGGSVQWFADTMRALGIEGQVIGIDLTPPVLLDDPAISTRVGDAAALADVLTPDLLKCCKRPLLVVEDSAHQYETCLAVLAFFHQHLQSGDYIVIEDGVVRFLPEEQYRTFEDGPCRAVADFLREHLAEYEVDRTLCDYFGHNATWNPDGWLRRL